MILVVLPPISQSTSSQKPTMKIGLAQSTEPSCELVMNDETSISHSCMTNSEKLKEAAAVASAAAIEADRLSTVARFPGGNSAPPPPPRRSPHTVLTPRQSSSFVPSIPSGLIGPLIDETFAHLAHSTSSLPLTASSPPVS
ncbi:unnamed protein product, partial [Protopolystoma xenopodis]